MNEDLEFLIREIGNQAGTNQLVVVSDNGSCCKVLREDYYPVDGKIVFHRKLTWSDGEEGYSVAEIMELFSKYGHMIEEVQFEAYDGTLWTPINCYESDSIGDDYTFSCFIVVGDIDGVMKRYGNPQNKNWFYSNGTGYP